MTLQLPLSNDCSIKFNIEDFPEPHEPFKLIEYGKYDGCELINSPICIAFSLK